MLKKLSIWIRHISRGWVALLSLVLFLSFTAFVLPAQSSKATLETSGAGSPDMSFFYSVDKLYKMAEAYGQAGRDAYIRVRFSFDLAWPLVYTIFLAISISWLFGKAFEPDSPWQSLNLVPVFAALFDYLENIATSLVMSQFPERIPILGMLASVFTMAKWLLVGFSFVILIFGCLAGGWRWVKNRR